MDRAKIRTLKDIVGSSCLSRLLDKGCELVDYHVGWNFGDGELAKEIATVRTGNHHILINGLTGDVAI